MRGLGISLTRSTKSFSFSFATAVHSSVEYNKGTHLMGDFSCNCSVFRVYTRTGDRIIGDFEKSRVFDMRRKAMETCGSWFKVEVSIFVKFGS